MNQHYFDVPFAFSGDVTAIPDPLQTGGTVSFTEGWNYNYQRNLSTDPAALPIDRSTMNWLFLQITQAIQAIQQTGCPEFITAAQNGGTAFSYGKGSRVLWSASGSAPFTKFVSLTAGNTNTPSTSDPLGTTTGWQIDVDPISTSAQAAAGTDNASIMTPLLVAQQTALRALLAGSATQVFNVGPATAATHAAEATQIQQNAFNYAGLAGGTANALTATLVPAPTSYTDYLTVVVRVAFNNTGSTSINVNGLGVKPVIGAAHSLLQGGELVAGGFACFAYSTNYSEAILLWATGGAEQVGAATQSNQATTLSQVQSLVRGYLTSTGYTTSQTLTNAVQGGLVIFSGSSAATFTAPLVSSMTNFQEVTFINEGTATLTVATQGSDKFATPTSSVATSIAVPQGSTLVITPSGAANLYHAMFGSAIRTGRLLGVQAFTNAGSFTYTPSVGTAFIVVKLKGGGGGSGGPVATSSNTVSASGPGTDGAYVEAIITSGFAGQTIVVGAGGTAGAAGSGSGGNGGASTFMTLSAGGGYGGGITGASTTSVVAGPNGIAAASGGNIKNQNGNGCGFSQAFALGAAGIGIPGYGGGGTSPGNAATSAGCGAGGLTNGFSASAQPGLAGFRGYVEVWEYGA